MQHIHACEAWNLTTGNYNVKVAVIDEGVNESHREFSNTAISYSYDVQNNQIGAHTYGFMALLWEESFLQDIMTIRWLVLLQMCQ